MASRRNPLGWGAAALIGLAALYLVWQIHLSGQPVWAVVVLVLCGLGFYVYLAEVALPFRYLFPGAAGMLVFVVFPLAYTIQIGFTNYSSANLLTFDRATAYLLEQTEAGSGGVYASSLYAEGTGYRLVLTPRHEEDDSDSADAGGTAGAGGGKAPAFITPALTLRTPAPTSEIVAVPLAQADLPAGDPLALAEVIRRRDLLSQLRVRLPDGTVLSYSGVREFAPLAPVWHRNDDGTLTRTRTGGIARADFRTGFYQTVDGVVLEPGFKVGVGFANYRRMVDDPEFRGPFIRIFVWTVVFAGLTVLFTLALGCSLAVLLNWEALRFRGLYRTLLFLPYAVPGFISILVFKGLFNPNSGEINHLLDALFGIRPAWFADPLLAKAMLLIVNTWLGYPYVMVLCTGLIKSIPADLYEASAIAGAGPWANFSTITAPLIVRPLMPLLIASFAFNFNNFVLIALLTDGRPDFLNTRVPAGTTDILVSYTYRIAFEDSGKNFGLAAAISTVIFILVALLSLANFRLTGVGRQEAR